MIGLISLNFKLDKWVINDYPVVLYYNGDESQITSSFVENEELYNYICENLLTLKAYSNSIILDITYFTDDDNEDTEEHVNKHSWKIDELFPLSKYPDLKSKLLNDILIDITSETNETRTSIRKLLEEGLAPSTIVNYVRYKSQQYNFNSENTIELVKEIQEQVKK
jgi:hypothetical protein